MPNATSLTAVNKSTSLLQPSMLTPIQSDAIDRIYDYDRTMLIAKMGAGKTIIALTAIADLLAHRVLKRILIIAPKKVCETVWRREHLKWEHTKHLRVSVATGAPRQREDAWEEDTDIYVINFENAVWFFDTYKRGHGFDGLIIDELSKLKSPSNKVFKRLRTRTKEFVWRVGMTGTPVSENYLGLYSQSLILDGGEAFGTRNDKFLNTYFYSTDFEQRNWELRTDAIPMLHQRLEYLVYNVPDYRDDLPEIKYIPVPVRMPKRASAVYKKLANDMITEVNGDTIIAQNSAVLSAKLQQVASGFLYDGDYVYTMHDAKIKKVIELAQTCKGSVLIAYWFQHEFEMLSEYFACPSLGGGLTTVQTGKIVDDWNAGRLKYLLIHPRSAGHGLNLAEGGNTIIWFGPQWSRDLWEQTNARLWRTGQTKEVTVYTVVAEKTVDELIEKRVDDKAKFDTLFNDHLVKTIDNGGLLLG